MIWVTCVIWNCPVATLKRHKWILIYFTYPNISRISFQHTVNIKQLRYFTSLYLVFKSQCVFYIYRRSEFRLATFQVLNGHLWLIAIVLDWVALDLDIEAKDWIEERRGALVFTDLQMCPQKGFPFGILKVVSHQKIQKCRGFIPGWANLWCAAL